MSLFKSKYEKQLDEMIQGIEMNMANNYKDNAQSGFREFEASYVKMKSEGLLKPKSEEHYDMIASDLQTRLQGYTHKDQKPYWT